MVNKRIEVGDLISDFSLKDQDKTDWILSAFKGKRVLLSFHPLAWTSVCADQMRCLERDMAVFDSLDTVPVGISVDSVPCKAAWSKDLGLQRLRILSDFWEHGKVAQSLGLFRDREGFSERANVLVDEQGVVVMVKVYPISELPDLQEVVRLIHELHHADVGENASAQQCMTDLQGKSLCVDDARNAGIDSTSTRHME